MAAFTLNWKDELRDLTRTIEKVGKVPQKHVTSSVKRASGPVLSDAKSGAPIESGDLVNGLVLRAEKSSKRGKKVYQVTFDAAMNDVFVKTSLEGKRSYYPASQEYGFITKNGGYIPGYHFLLNAAAKNGATFMAHVITFMMEKIAKEWVKKNA